MDKVTSFVLMSLLGEVYTCLILLLLSISLKKIEEVDITNHFSIVLKNKGNCMQYTDLVGFKQK